jgi:hypothetical protein
MKRYTVSQARERLADVLDEAEQNGGVVIERRDVQYVIRARRRARGARAGGSAIEIVDPTLADGQWGWKWTQGGVRFDARRRRS